jgi:hypothetical protein
VLMGFATTLPPILTTMRMIGASGGCNVV